MVRRRDALSQLEIRCRWVCGVRSRWDEIQVTKLCAESRLLPPPARMSVENQPGETDTVLVARVGCAVERSLWGPVFCQVRCRRGPGARVPGRWAEARGDREVPGFLDHVISGEPTRRRDGRGWQVEGVCWCQGEAGGALRSLFLRMVTWFLGGSGHVRTWADRCVAAETVENLAGRRALRVLCKERDAEAMLRSRSNAIRNSSQRGGSWALPPTKLPLLGPDGVRGRCGPLVKSPASRCQESARRTSWTCNSDCVSCCLGATLRCRGWCGGSHVSVTNLKIFSNFGFRARNRLCYFQPDLHEELF